MPRKPRVTKPAVTELKTAVTSELPTAEKPLSEGEQAPQSSERPHTNQVGTRNGRFMNQRKPVQQKLPRTINQMSRSHGNKKGTKQMRSTNFAWN